MSYAIEFPPEAAEQLLARKRKDIIPEVQEQLKRLGRSPALATRFESGPLAGRSIYTIRAFRAPIAWRVAVLFQFSQDEERIVIGGFGILRGDPPRLVEPDPC